MLAAGTLETLAAPQVPVFAKLAACLVIALTSWKAEAGLAAVVAIAPAGLILAPAPARAAELVAWSFLAAWLLAVWRPLTDPAVAAATGLREPDEPRLPGSPSAASLHADSRAVVPTDGVVPARAAAAMGGAAPSLLGASAAVVPAVLYGACAVASWAGYTIRGAPGVPPHLLPLMLVRALDARHLVFASPQPETLTLLTTLAGLAVFIAAACIARGRLDVRRHLVVALAAASTGLAALTLADVLRQWSAVGYGAWFLLRYARGERFSFLEDLNAAGSFFALGMLAALAMSVGTRRHRWLWIATVALTAPALVLSGSRSAMLAVLAAAGILLAGMRRGAVPRLGPATSVAVVLIVAAAGAAVAAASLGGAAEQGTASGSLRLRSQFLVTSMRMVASAPVFGVGIGHYHERSNEFMPPALREVYRYENAHNYFAQQFAELGIVGGTLFVWLVTASIRGGWRAARDHSAAGSRHQAPGTRHVHQAPGTTHVHQAPGTRHAHQAPGTTHEHQAPGTTHDAPRTDAALLGLLAGTVAYVVTCVTGHPLLVPEAALPFWGAFGALAAAAPEPEAASTRSPLRRTLVKVVLLVLAVGIVLDARHYALATGPPGERGFYALERTGDRPFVWMTRHGTFYLGPQPGTLVIPMRAPDLVTRDEPFYVSVDVGGRRAGTYEVVPGRWTEIEIRLRDRTSTAFRRIDLRASRSWSPMRDRGAREDNLPRSVMVGETRWTPAGGR